MTIKATHRSFNPDISPKTYLRNKPSRSPPTVLLFKSSFCHFLCREKPSPVHPPNAGAPSSELATEGQTTDLCVPMGQEEETYQAGGGGQGRGGADQHAVDSQPREMLTR